MSLAAAVILNVTVVALSAVCTTASAGVVRSAAEHAQPEGAALAKVMMTVWAEQGEPPT
jgi:hypothetical protein